MKSEKVTKKPKTSERWYDDACGTAHALELVGERWALLIVRELMFGARRFSELRADLPGLSANVLTQRLEGLEAAGVVTRRKLPPPASVQVYELTPWGYESEPIIQVMGRWAVRSPAHDPTLPLSPSSLMLSLRTMLARERAVGLVVRVGFRCGEQAFVARLAGGELVVTRGEPVDTDVLLEGAPSALASLIYGGRPLGEAEAAGEVRVEGSRALARRFVTLFPLPPKVGAR